MKTFLYIQPISREFCDPYGCIKLDMNYDVHRFLTFPLQKRLSFENQVRPLTLAQAGFYYSEEDLIKCSGCPFLLHSTDLFHHVNQIPHSHLPDKIHQWHLNDARYCRFELDNILVGFHWL
jgi:hypothetical protein